MAISLVQATGMSNFNMNTVAAIWPATTSPNDLLVAALGVNNTGVNITPPSGWTQAYQYANGYLVVLYYIPPSTATRSGSETFSFGGTSAAASLILVEYRGAASSNVLKQAGPGSGAAAPGMNAAQVNVTANGVVVAAFGIAQSSASFSNPGPTGPPAASLVTQACSSMVGSSLALCHLLPTATGQQQLTLNGPNGVQYTSPAASFDPA